MILLDLFCGAGGAAEGYRRAGFEVVGVDCAPQPRYPGQFIQADALVDLRWIVSEVRPSAVHASPPCQRYSSITRTRGKADQHADLVAPTRLALAVTGLPTVIENVPRAPLIEPVMLCGASLCGTIERDGRPFYLRRHRLFECNFPLLTPACACSPSRGKVLGVYGGGTSEGRHNPGGGNPSKATKEEAVAIMGIDWMTKGEMNQAIPPAYTEYIGQFLHDVIADRSHAVAGRDLAAD